MSDTKPDTPEITMLESGYEKSDVELKKLFPLTATVLIFLVISIVLLNDFLIRSEEQQYYESVLKPKSQELMEVRQRADSLLSSYGRDELDLDVYRIPIDRAMQKLVEENAR